jgi:hypothetical protein
MHITVDFRPIVLKIKGTFLGRILKYMHTLFCNQSSCKSGYLHCISHPVLDLCYVLLKLSMNEYIVLLTLSLNETIILLTVPLSEDFVLVTRFLND